MNKGEQDVRVEGIETGALSEKPKPKRRRIITAGRAGLLLVLLPPAVMFFIITVIGPHRHTLLSTPQARYLMFTILNMSGLLGVLGVMLAFRAIVQNTPRNQSARPSELVLGCIGLGIFVFGLLQPTGPVMLSGLVNLAITGKEYNNREDRESQDLREIYDTYIQFTQNHPKKCLPRLSKQAGRLMQALCDLGCNRGPSPYIADHDPDYKRFYDDLEVLKLGEGADVDDWSYFYLGYEVKNDKDMEAFAEAYKRIIQSGQTFEQDLTIEGGSPSEGKTVLHRLNILPPPIPPGAKRPPLPGLRADIPVLIERIDHNKNKGGHVLFLDGHVEFIDYPGRWPMTEKTISILNELDEMGPQGPAPGGRND
ncbi:MAG TPA: hypothetical protein PLI09_18085 [Candidatus Hydrogenedentes bacterium]|nr:hypothetical protein [Candidatus Hydrogenedentota bacterium]